MCSTTGIAVSLRGLLSDEDNYVRCLTAQALTILAGKEILLMGIHKCIRLKINKWGTTSGDNDFGVSFLGFISCLPINWEASETPFSLR